MKPTFFYLSSCSTCIRILKELNLPETIVLHDIKGSPLDTATVDFLFSLTGNYESLINKRAKLYKERGLKDKNLTENDYRKLLTEHYTFLKRPVLILNNQIFVGNDAKTVGAMKEALSKFR